jgi:hypothetical protein
MWQVALVCALAHASHLLTDWLGADQFYPPGIQLLWPFSDGWYISGWDLFSRVERRNLFSWPTISTNLVAAAREIAILGSVVAALWFSRTGSKETCN